MTILGYIASSIFLVVSAGFGLVAIRFDRKLRSLDIDQPPRIRRIYRIESRVMRPGSDTHEACRVFDINLN